MSPKSSQYAYTLKHIQRLFRQQNKYGEQIFLYVTRSFLKCLVYQYILLLLHSGKDYL